MCSFEATKSTKGASKLRRDLINSEIANLRDLLPLPSSTRQRLSQLQLMALVCVYVRKANYFQQVFKRHHELGHPFSTPNIGFSKALSGFLIMMTQNGKLLYISDNAAEYLGHSMEDLLIHGDSVYDIIDKADHGTVQTELLRTSNTHSPPGEETRLFLCRMNVSRNARRQMRFGDQKVVLVAGHFLSYLPLCSRNEPVFVAVCTPVAMPETRECVVQGATNVFTTIHHMDMKFIHIDRNGEHYLGYSRAELQGISWYQLIHWNYMREAQTKHRLISQSEQEKSCILLLRLRTRTSEWLWIHCVLQVKEGQDSQQTQQSVIVATNQVLSEREAAVMRANAWIYHYYTVQTKLQYGLAYPEATGPGAGSPTAAAAAAARLAAAAYFPTSKLINYGGHGGPHLHPHHHQTHLQPPAPHHPISPDSTGGYSPMPPPLQSPHNGAYATAHPYPHHSFDVRSGKESPLDFSLAASSSSPLYEFPAGYPSAPYWSHHPHYHPHHPHGYLNQRGAEDGTAAALSAVAASAASPHSWSLLSGASALNHTSNHSQHNSHQGHGQHSHNHAASAGGNRTLIASLSPSSVSISKGNSKRLKKSAELVNESDAHSAAATRGSIETHIGQADLTPRHQQQHMGYGAGSDVLTMVSTFAHHIRPRKILGSEASEDEQVSAEEESITMTCPLTPSPIWEGQAHRVPDLQLYNNGERERHHLALSATNDHLIHCVPTYEQVNAVYSFYPPASSAGGGGAMMMSNHASNSIISLASNGREGKAE